MEYIKFNGILKKVQENYKSDHNIVSFLKDELKISESKAILLAEKITKMYDFKANALFSSKLSEIKLDEKIKEEKSLKFNIYSLDNLSGKEFEDFLKWMFEELGYSVELTKATADSGVDLVIKKDKEKIAVQAKRYNRTSKISNEVVLKTHGGMAVYKCDKSIIITTSYFTSQARKDAEKLKMELWDRETLSATMDQINHKPGASKPKKDFPEYKNTLFDSLKNLKSMNIFIVKSKDDDKYDIYRHGIKYPILSFRGNWTSVTRLSFRIKNKKPIPEYGRDSWPIITSDRGTTYGPDGKSAYMQIVQYLSEFV